MTSPPSRGGTAHHVSGLMNVVTNRTEPSPSSTLQPLPCSPPHLVGVAERVVRRVNDDLRVVVRVRAAVRCRPGSLAPLFSDGHGRKSSAAV